MKKIVLDILFKAPYFKVGEINERTKGIWFIFHGYGQLAGEFAKSFNELNSEESCLIFPQGLSKFYLKGIGNKIGANWMTSLDRDIDISNYISYINHIFDHEVKPYQDNIELNILGFSQGGHTASRWIYHSNIRYNKLILWGSSLAHEIDQKKITESFSNGKNLIVFGDQDRFIDADRLQKLRNRYKNIGFNYQTIEYPGGHDIYPEILKKLA